MTGISEPKTSQTYMKENTLKFKFKVVHNRSPLWQGKINTNPKAEIHTTTEKQFITDGMHEIDFELIHSGYMYVFS